MPPRAIKFHEVHGSSIRLSADGSKAHLTRFCHGLCFTNRPVHIMETIILDIHPDFKVPGGGVRFGLTKEDPFRLRGKLPQFLHLARDGDFWLRGRPLVPECSRIMTKKIMIGVDPDFGLMIINDDGTREELYTGIDDRKSIGSYYLIIDLFVNTGKISITSRPADIYLFKRSTVRPRPKSRSFPNFILKEACFRSSFGTELQVHGQVAISAKTTVCDDNFVIVKTSLGLNSVLIVELAALKRSAPVRIILADEEFDLIQKRNRNRRLIGYSEAVTITGFFVIESERPAVGEELAIRVSETGLVSVNHGDRGWSSRLTVDPALRYHVMFDMQNVSVLFLTGITTREEQVSRSTGIVPRVSFILPECIICLDDPREIILIPCRHVSICETCREKLAREAPFKCPVCRSDVDKAEKIYLA